MAAVTKMCSYYGGMDDLQNDVQVQWMAVVLLQPVWDCCSMHCDGAQLLNFCALNQPAIAAMSAHIDPLTHRRCSLHRSVV